MIEIGALVPSGTDEYTTYVYGVGGTIGTDLFSNDLIAKVEYPTKTGASAGQPSTSASDDISYAYDLLGETATKTDQNGNMHAYSYDVLGRLTLDAVTTLGSGVDGAVRALGYSYTALGLPYQDTSYSDAAGTTVVNQVQDDYNGFGQVVTEYQEHSGAVNTGSSANVQYVYDTSGANDTRLIAMIYPNGRQLDYVYNSGLDSDISRVSALADDGGSDAGTIQSYAYLGLNTIVQKTDGNGTELTYIHQAGDTLAGGAGGNGGDRYTGLDEFGRVVDQNWINTSTGASTERLQYAYDADGNVLYKNDLVNGSSDSVLYHGNSSSSADDASAYDALNRVVSYTPGTLSASGNNGSYLDTVSGGTTQTISYDAVDNITSRSGTSYTYNGQNQLTTTSPTYDNNGNMTLQAGISYSYDAWNRMIYTSSGFGGDGYFTYDAQGRRTYESAYGEERYYDAAGQEIQDGVDGYGSSPVIIAQYVWGLGYVNDMVLRDDSFVNFESGNLGITGSELNRRTYVQQDADWDNVGLADNSGTVQDSFFYTNPTGGVTGTAGGVFFGSTYLWSYGFQGGRGDMPNIWHFGARDYDTNGPSGHWMEEEPMGAGYIDGANLYQFERGNTVVNTDSTGLSITINDPNYAYAQQVRDGLQRIIGTCYPLTLKPNMAPDIQIGASPPENGGMPNVATHWHVQSYTLEMGPKNPSCKPGCLGCANLLKQAIDGRKPLEIYWGSDKDNAYTRTFNGKAAITINGDLSQYTTPDVDPVDGSIYNASPPWEVTLWHELIGHGFLGTDHPGGHDYDPTVRVENLARQCLRNQGVPINERSHDYTK